MPGSIGSAETQACSAAAARKPAAGHTRDLGLLDEVLECVLLGVIATTNRMCV
jgi:hypothetical protein